MSACTYNLFLSRNKKINVYPSKPQFYCIKVGFKGVKTIKACFVMFRVTVYSCYIFRVC